MSGGRRRSPSTQSRDLEDARRGRRGGEDDRHRTNSSVRYRRSSRSPIRSRSRSRSRERYHHHRRNSPKRSRSPSPPGTHLSHSSRGADSFRSRILHGEDYRGDAHALHPSQDMSNMTEEEQMKALLGFGGFSTTKGEPVSDNATTSAVGGVRKSSKRVYRQYMNRRGGFNKPL